MGVKLNLISPEVSAQWPEKPGDAIVVNNFDHISLVWCCPRCGQVSSTARGYKHVFDSNTNSLTPSIIHAKEMGGCGYHGWLKNGVFTEC